MKFMAYQWNPNEIYGVPMESTNWFVPLVVPTSCAEAPCGGKKSDPRRSTAAGRENLQSKAADPGRKKCGVTEFLLKKKSDPRRSSAAGRENLQSKSASVAVVAVAAVVVATRESRLCRQSQTA